MKYLLILFILLSSSISFSQSITGIDFNDKNQYTNWLEGQDEKGTYFIKEDVGMFKNAMFRDNTLSMSKKYPSKEDFNEVYLEVVTGYGEPTYFNDKVTKKKKKKEEESDYYEEPVEEPVDDRTLEGIIQDGELEMIRTWEFAEYKINLIWNKEGLFFNVKYL